MNARVGWRDEVVAVVAIGGVVTALGACDPKPKDDGGGFDAAVLVVGAPDKVPPIAPLNGGPPPAIDAGNLDTQPPLVQARVFEANGQWWMARLVLEKKALGADGTKEEAELLAKICQQQSDEACVEACGTKLGRKIKFDAGASHASSARADAGRAAPLHAEPDSELARTRDLVLKMQYEPARKALEPKVLDGHASREEIRLLKTICEKQNDRMCVALCDAKLK